MTANLPSKIATLPPMTALDVSQMQPSEIAHHRAQILASVEVVLHGYWQPDDAQGLRAAVLADWCDELEPWPVESIRAALRKHRKDFPNRRPNPGHILAILTDAWGRRNADQVKAAMAKPEPVRDLPSPERRAEMAAEVARTLAGLGKPAPSVIINAEIAAAAADHGVTEDEIRGYDRRPHVVAARDQAMQAAHERGVPLAEIGRVMGRDHTSVMHAVRKSPIRTEVRGC